MTQLSLNQNSFTETAIIGMLSQDEQPNTLVCQINPAGTGVYVAGQPVKLIATAGPQFIVDACASVTDGPILGVICYSKQKNIFSPSDQIEVAGRGNIIFLAAGAAINRGTTVSITPAPNTATDALVNTDVTDTHYILGAAMGQTASAGGPLRIFVAPGIRAGGVLAPTAP